MKYLITILICFAFCLLTSCSSSLYSQPVLASTNVNSVPQHKALGRVESSSCDRYIFPFIIIPSDFKKAYKNVFEQAEGMGGDGIVNVQIRNKSYTHILWFLYASSCYTLTGEAVKFTDGESSWDKSPEKQKSSWDAAPEQGGEEQNIEQQKSSWD